MTDTFVLKLPKALKAPPPPPPPKPNWVVQLPGPYEARIFKKTRDVWPMRWMHPMMMYVGEKTDKPRKETYFDIRLFKDGTERQASQTANDLKGVEPALKEMVEWCEGYIRRDAERAEVASAAQELLAAEKPKRKRARA
jgi:hypothetical protein